MYDAFICYSRSVDTGLAIALRYGLHGFNRHWNELRALHVFRDDSNLAANPALWPSIMKTLDESRYLILLASESAANSVWVERELRYWCEHKDPQHIQLVLTDPEPSIGWNDERNDFDWSVTTAVPRCLGGVFIAEPRWLSLPRTARSLSLRDSVFKDVVADVATPLHGKAKDELIGKDVRKRQLGRRFLGVGITLIVLTAVIAVQQAIVARRAQHDAENQLRTAVAGRLLVQADGLRQTDPRTALRLGLAAHRTQPGPATTAGLVRTLSTAPGFRLGEPLIGHSGPVQTIAFSPDGRTLATGSTDKTVSLWDMTDRMRPRRVGGLSGLGGEVRSVAFSPDGRTLAGGVGASVVLWDVTDRRKPQPVGEPLVTAAAVRSVTFAPDRSLLAAGSRDGIAHLWDVSDPAHPRLLGPPLVGHDYPVNSVALSRDGHTLATGSDDHTVVLWDLTDPSQPRRLAQPLRDPAPVLSVAFSPDGRTLATSSDAPGSNSSTVTVRDIGDRAQPQVLGQPIRGLNDSARTIAFNPAGRRLATGGGDNAVSQWDMTDRSQPRWLGPQLTGHTNVVAAVAFSPDGRTLATGSYDTTVILWDVADGLNKPRRLDMPAGHNDSANLVAFSPNGRTLATGSADKTVILWDVARRTPLGPPLNDGAFGVWSLAFSPNNCVLAVADGLSTVTLWGAGAPPRALPQIPVGAGQWAESVAFSPDGRKLAIASFFRVIFWDLSNPASPQYLGEVKPLDQYGPIYSLKFSPDGNTVAASTYSGGFELLEVGDGKHPRTRTKRAVTSHLKQVNSLDFSPDGHTLATGSNDTTVILWDITDPTNPRPYGQPLTGHDNKVWAVAFASNQPILATGSDDNSVILWYIADPARPVQLTRLPTGGANPTYSVAFSPDGRTLAAGTHDKSPILWNLDTLRGLINDPAWRACSLTDGLDKPTWTFYVHELPYQDPCR